MTPLWKLRLTAANSSKRREQSLRLAATASQSKAGKFRLTKLANSLSKGVTTVLLEMRGPAISASNWPSVVTSNISVFLKRRDHNEGDNWCYRKMRHHERAGGEDSDTDTYLS